MTTRRSLAALAGFAAVVTLVAVVGSLAAVSARSTYAALDLPSWAPPGWLFGPVWTVLYALIAVSGWLVWRRVGWDRSLTMYAVQLALNAVWTPLFFGADRYGLALVEIVVLDVAVVATIVLFRARHRVAAALLLPYLAWVLFATALNAAIWQAN